MGLYAHELRPGVGHVKLLVAQHGGEHVGGAAIGEHLPVEGEAAGGRFFGEVEERQQRGIGVILDTQLVESPLARSQPGQLQPRAGAVELGQDRPAASDEQLGVPLLVAGVAEKQAAQQRVLGELGGAGEIAPPVGLGAGEGEQLAGATARVPPHPSV